MAECAEPCNDDPVNIYGIQIYTEDSGICKAASHMGVL
jgi:hypothetical protein